jgi:hypothetical protein
MERTRTPHLTLVLPAAPARAEDDAVLAEAFDDPAIVRALIRLSRTNELAMKGVRLALACHVQRWHRLMHPGEALPSDLTEDVLAALLERFAEPLAA